MKIPGLKPEEQKAIDAELEKGNAEAHKRTRQYVDRAVKEIGSIVSQRGIRKVRAGKSVQAIRDGTRTSQILPNGDTFLGSDIDDVTHTSFIVFSEAQTYNSEDFEEGDILIGDNTDGMSNIKWDASEGQWQFRTGTTVQVYMDTDGSISGGGVLWNADGITLSDGTVLNGSIQKNDTGGYDIYHTVTVNSILRILKLGAVASNDGTYPEIEISWHDPTQTNLLTTNPGFESGSLTGWTASGTAAASAVAPYEGSYYGKVTTGTLETASGNRAAVTAGTVYSVGAAATWGTVTVQWYDNAGTSKGTTTVGSTTGWALLTTTVAAPTGATKAGIKVTGYFPAGPTKPFGLDSVYIYPSTELQAVRVTDDAIKMTDLRVEGFMNMTKGSTLTIAGGIVTATCSRHAIDTEGAAAADNLDTINGASAGGDMLVISCENNARVVTAKDVTGNLQLAGDFVMNNIANRLTLMWNSDNSKWVELARSSNA